MTTDPNLTAFRATIAGIITETKATTPPKHHAALDAIAGTLHMIPGHMVPDFIGLDATTGGAITALLRDDITSMAADGISSEIGDAGAYIRALVIFIDAIRTNETEWIAHRVRRTLDRKHVYDA